MHNSDVGRAEIHSRKSEWEEIKLQMWAILVEEKEEYRSLDGEEARVMGALTFSLFLCFFLFLFFIFYIVVDFVIH